jgi:hypothetical protein
MPKPAQPVTQTERELQLMPCRSRIKGA